ncbi:hypothetical protein ADICYQ_4161 [Cyclobacterium qasimii M12-11B]|uniref:Lipoprotein SmpA/OmlA domain-containing protein n=2 Tax=Cyclobacterium qasimii TaxID=1350429 RepID=S7V9G6_9BACT|nr:hypothetical protein ADICYQ_4161 [Cyclobacterium qasimii M12-11B]
MYLKKFKNWILSAFLMVFLHSCASLQVAHMTSAEMNKLELGMSKEQVTQILGTDYTIAEKRLEDDNEIEVLSYRDHFENDEFYLFVFKNQKLEKWYRELLPKERIENK